MSGDRGVTGSSSHKQGRKERAARETEDQDAPSRSDFSVVAWAPYSETFHSLPASVAVTTGAVRKDGRPRGNDRRRKEDR